MVPLWLGVFLLSQLATTNGWEQISVEIPKKCVEGTLIPHPYDENKYLECVDAGEPREMQCALGHIFDASTSVCRPSRRKSEMKSVSNWKNTLSSLFNAVEHVLRSILNYIKNNEVIKSLAQWISNVVQGVMGFVSRKKDSGSVQWEQEITEKHNPPPISPDDEKPWLSFGSEPLWEHGKRPNHIPSPAQFKPYFTH